MNEPLGKLLQTLEPGGTNRDLSDAPEEPDMQARRAELRAAVTDARASPDATTAICWSSPQQPDGPIVPIWDNLNVHKAASLREFADSRDWPTIYYLPPYAPDLNPVEGIWPLLQRGQLSHVTFSTPEHLVQCIRRGLRHIQYHSDLIDSCLTKADLTIKPT
ncbi:transposase [Nocardiopsis sp. CNT-189]|uniref:transposase n=1 Tax=Nocardiopsis oceanisediminis TaxID=2816862 RepID=UPI003B2CB3E0